MALRAPGNFQERTPGDCRHADLPPEKGRRKPDNCGCMQVCPLPFEPLMFFYMHDRIEIPRRPAGFPRAHLPRQFSGTARLQPRGGSLSRSSGFSAGLPLPWQVVQGLLNDLPAPAAIRAYGNVCHRAAADRAGTPDLTGPPACGTVPQETGLCTRTMAGRALGTGAGPRR